MDMTGNHMVEDRTVNLVQVERVHKGVVMAKHQSDYGQR
jgi:hypothetical protein